MLYPYHTPRNFSRTPRFDPHSTKATCPIFSHVHSKPLSEKHNVNTNNHASLCDLEPPKAHAQCQRRINHWYRILSSTEHNMHCTVTPLLAQSLTCANQGSVSMERVNAKLMFEPSLQRLSRIRHLELLVQSTPGPHMIFLRRVIHKCCAAVRPKRVRVHGR